MSSLKNRAAVSIGVLDANLFDVNELIADPLVLGLPDSRRTDPRHTPVQRLTSRARSST